MGKNNLSLKFNFQQAIIRIPRMLKKGAKKFKS